MSKKRKREPKEALGEIYRGQEVMVIREKLKGSPCSCSNPGCSDEILPGELILNVYDWRIGRKLGMLHGEDSDFSCLRELLGGSEINWSRLKKALLEVPSAV